MVVNVENLLEELRRLCVKPAQCSLFFSQHGVELELVWNFFRNKTSSSLQLLVIKFPKPLASKRSEIEEPDVAVA